MAEIELFHYRTGRGVLHRFHTGFKLLSMILLSISIFRGEVIELTTLSLFISAVFMIEYYQSHILSPAKLFEKIKGFLFFLILIVFTRGLTVQGIPIKYLPIFSIEGLYSGVIYSWKLLLMIILGQVFTSTTDPVNIHGAIYRILQPLPLINAGNAATMISLTITFIPLIFDQYIEVRNAYESRLGNRSANPVKKISSLTLPLLQSTLMRADEVTLAMESRCYSDSPTLPAMKITRTDIIGLFICLAIPFIFILSKL